MTGDAASEEPPEGQLVWQENERGLHLTLRVGGRLFRASGVTAESVLQTMVVILSDASRSADREGEGEK